jgi:5'-methylthioadenosine phosphorylase
MEGPAFSTRAESHMHRAWGADVIGMTNMPEAKLAREAELCYVTVALATDYDCWRAGEHVDVATVIGTMKKNVANAHKLLIDVVPKIPETRKCSCASALQGAIQSDPKYVSKETWKKYDVLLGKYRR